jgi:hypothetical protein
VTVLGSNGQVSEVRPVEAGSPLAPGAEVIVEAVVIAPTAISAARAMSPPTPHRPPGVTRVFGSGAAAFRPCAAST